MLIVFSIEEDKSKIYYCADVVRWEAKDSISHSRINKLNQLIRILQPNNCGRIYMSEYWNPNNHLAEAPNFDENTQSCKNLLSLRNVRRIAVPFGIEKMVKISDGTSIAKGRERSGHAYVKDDAELRTLLNKKP